MMNFSYCNKISFELYLWQCFCHLSAQLWFVLLLSQVALEHLPDHVLHSALWEALSRLHLVCVFHLHCGTMHVLRTGFIHEWNRAHGPRLQKKCFKTQCSVILWSIWFMFEINPLVNTSPWFPRSQKSKCSGLHLKNLIKISPKHPSAEIAVRDRLEI